MKILVTGSSGFIGQNLVLHLRRLGHQVIECHSRTLDLTDKKSTNKFVCEIAPDSVIHLASVAIRSSERNCAVSDEVHMIDNLFLETKGNCQFIFAGSMAEYGCSGRHREIDECSPMNQYAKAKYEASMRLLELATARGSPATVLRIFGAYGRFEAKSRLIPSVVESLSKRTSISLSDCTQLRDFVLVDDICTVISKLCNLPTDKLPKILNIGTGQAVSVRQAIVKLAIEMHAPLELLKFDTRARSVHDQDFLEADTTLLNNLFEFVPEQHFILEQPLIPKLL